MKAFILFIYLLLLSGVISGQIIYSDLEDETMYMPSVPSGVGWVSNNYDFFINNDSIIDFTFGLRVIKSLWEYPVFQVFATQQIHLKDSSFRLVKDSMQSCMRIIVENDTINSLQFWSLSNSSLAIFGENYFTQENNKSWFCNDPDSYKFFGFSFAINGNTHYGWMRLSWNTTSVTFHDFAYNGVPDEMILAGQTGIVAYSEVKEYNPFSIVIKNNVAQINFYKRNKSLAKLTIYDMTGSYINSIEVKGSHDCFDLNELSTGLYILHITQNNNHSIKKIFIK